MQEELKAGDKVLYRSRQSPEQYNYSIPSKIHRATIVAIDGKMASIIRHTPQGDSPVQVVPVSRLRKEEHTQ